MAFSRFVAPLSKTGSRFAPLQRLTTHLLAAAVVASVVAGCQTVEFWELEALSDPVMEMESGAAEVHFHQKGFYSMEGSAGGIGETAGGGCGCY